MSEKLLVSTSITTNSKNLKYKDYTEFREFIRKLKCIACQIEDSEEKVPSLGTLDLMPGLENISDPHHIKTVGSGGPDAENLVPLCRKHHSILGNEGSITFQLKRNLDFKEIAIKIFNIFCNSDELKEAPNKAFAYHQRLLALIDNVKQATLHCADSILKFIELNLAGVPAYKWLGFESINQYATTPIDQGGLGLKQRTVHRLLAMSQVKVLTGNDSDLVRDLGTYKSEIVLPIIKNKQTIQERKEICFQIQSMTVADAISWKNNIIGKPDKREKFQRSVELSIRKFLIQRGVSSLLNETEQLSWNIVKIAEQSRML